MVRIREGEHPGHSRKCEQHQLTNDPACVLIYTNSQCIFCPAAREILESVLGEHGLPIELVREVDCDREEVRDISGLPTIRICGEAIIGLPEKDTLDRALWKLKVNPCFYISQTTEV